MSMTVLTPELNPSMDSYRVGTLLEMVREIATRDVSCSTLATLLLYAQAHGTTEAEISALLAPLSTQSPKPFAKVCVCVWVCVLPYPPLRCATAGQSTVHS